MWSEFLLWFEWQSFLRSTIMCGVPSLILFSVLPNPAILWFISIGFWLTLLVQFRMLEVFLGKKRMFIIHPTVTSEETEEPVSAQWERFDKSPRKLAANLPYSYYGVFALYVAVDMLVYYLNETVAISPKWMFCGILCVTTLIIVVLQMSYFPQLRCVPKRIPLKRTFTELKERVESFGNWVMEQTKDKPTFNPKKERRQRTPKKGQQK